MLNGNYKQTLSTSYIYFLINTLKIKDLMTLLVNKFPTVYQGFLCPEMSVIFKLKIPNYDVHGSNQEALHLNIPWVVFRDHG